MSQNKSSATTWTGRILGMLLIGYYGYQQYIMSERLLIPESPLLSTVLVTLGGVLILGGAEYLRSKNFTRDEKGRLTLQSRISDKKDD